MEFGKHLKRLRESRGYSIRHLAYKSGVSFGQISKIEQGTRGTPKPKTIEKLAKGLGVSYDYLMELAGYVKPEKPDQPVEFVCIIFPLFYEKIVDKNLIRLYNKNRKNGNGG